MIIIIIIHIIIHIIIIIIIIVIIVLIIKKGPRGSSITANLRTNITDFRGFDSSIVLILRGGIIMSVGDITESSSQRV